MEETKIFVCNCHSLEHQVKFMHDADDDALYVYIHLNQRNSFWKRLVAGIKYAFGYSSRFGEWDEFIFQEKDLDTPK